MVQVIQRTRPTFGEQIGSGLGRGLERGIGLGGEYAVQQQGKKAERAQKLAGLENLKKSEYWKNASDLEKAVLEREIVGDISAQTSKSLINLERERKAYDVLSGLQGDEGGEQSQAGGMPEGAFGGEGAGETQPPKRGKPSFDYDQHLEKLDAKIDKWNKGLTSPNKDVRDTAAKNIEQLNKKKEFAFKQREAEQKHQHQKGQMEYQEAKPTIDIANKLALSLPNQLQDLEAMQDALKNKDFSFFSLDNFAEMSGIEAFRSPEGAQFKAAIKNYFLGDVKGVGGKGLNQFLEKQLNDAMLKFGRDNEANETVLAGYKAKYDREQMWYDQFRKLYKKQKEGQGHVNGDIGQEVDEELRPYYEARQKQLKAEIEAIKHSGKGLSGKMLDVVGPDGAEYEIDESQVGDLPEGFRLK